jgi:hypothetical protein
VRVIKAVLAEVMNMPGTLKSMSKMLFPIFLWILWANHVGAKNWAIGKLCYEEFQKVFGVMKV